MIVSPKFTLKLVEYEGAKLVLNANEVQQLRKTYPNIKATTLYKGRSVRACEKPSKCISIPVSDYLKGANHASNQSLFANC